MNSHQQPPSAKRISPARITIGILMIAIALWSVISNPPDGVGAALLGQFVFILAFLGVGLKLVFRRPK